MLWPTRKEWQRWSKPAKITAVSGLVGSLSLILAVVVMFKPQRTLAPTKQISGMLSQRQPGRHGRQPSSQPLDESLQRRADVATSAKAFSAVTFEEFMEAIYSWELTDLQRGQFVKQHVGKTVIWEGNVAGVSEAGDVISVLLRHSPDSRYLAFLAFDPSSRDELLQLDRGTKIEVACLLEDWGAEAELINCRLLREHRALAAR